ncbi:MAG: SDR family oxidoreductase [Candidatus Promineifilaceae bacterium]|nr:SDR family oxidoreductase [Candidatus Promineifilaceae bacterium]
MKNIVITGVSTGIGMATAAELTRRNYQVFGSVRRQEDAQRLQEVLGSRFTPLLFDVTDSAAIQTAVAEVKEVTASEGLFALINNAGIVIPGPLMHLPIEDFRAQFQVNLFGLLDVTQQFLPLLGAVKDALHPPGRIINISSVSGKIAYPFMGGYAASKHALEAMSDTLRRELMLYGIDVIVIEPGTTNTPIKTKYKNQIEKYAATDYGELFAGLEQQLAERERSGLPVEKVVTAICEAIESERPKTRYAVPRKRLTGWLIPRWLPDRWLDRLVANQLGLKP